MDPNNMHHNMKTGLQRLVGKAHKDLMHHNMKTGLQRLVAKAHNDLGSDPDVPIIKFPGDVPFLKVVYNGEDAEMTYEPGGDTFDIWEIGGSPPIALGKKALDWDSAAQVLANSQPESNEQ